jgi:hypothetical protein
VQSIIEFNATLLRKLHETFRHRSEGPEAFEAWSRACEEFHDRLDEIAFPGGLRAGLRRIEGLDVPTCSRISLSSDRFIEALPLLVCLSYPLR